MTNSFGSVRFAIQTSWGSRPERVSSRACLDSHELSEARGSVYWTLVLLEWTACTQRGASTGGGPQPAAQVSPIRSPGFGSAGRDAPGHERGSVVAGSVRPADGGPTPRPRGPLARLWRGSRRPPPRPDTRPRPASRLRESRTRGSDGW